jgi:hypothetical protein
MMLAQAFLEAHDSEILGLDWAHSPLADTAPSAAGGERRRSSGLMLASAGRDGFVHVFRSSAGAAGCHGLLTPLDTLDDHGGAAVAAARFSGGGSRLVTCGGDRSVALHALNLASRGGAAGGVAPATLLRRAALSAADCAVECATGRRAALAARDGGLVVLDTSSGAELCRWGTRFPTPGRILGRFVCRESA